MNEVSFMSVPTTIYAANKFFKQHFTEEVYGIQINCIYQELLSQQKYE